MWLESTLDLDLLEDLDAKLVDADLAILDPPRDGEENGLPNRERRPMTDPARTARGDHRKYGLFRSLPETEFELFPLLFKFLK